MNSWHLLQRLGTLFVILALAGCGNTPSSTTPAITYTPDFIPAVRAYGGGGYDDFQFDSMKALGIGYAQVELVWPLIEPSDDGWNWGEVDEKLDRVNQSGLKVILFIMCFKDTGLPWDETVTRDDLQFVSEYNEYAYEVVNRYYTHPAWSGIVAVWGGSADVWDPNYAVTDPEVVVPLMNAAYDGIKRADPNTIVVGFNFATTAHSREQWEEYHVRAFVLSPEFDWYGVQSHAILTTILEEPGAYTGVQGLVNVRRFLDEHGYADKPLWLNEGGFPHGEDLGGLSDQMHAEQVVESYVIARTLDVNLRGWVYFDYFGKSREDDQGLYGLMTALEEASPPQPRQAWYALQTLVETVRFFDYQFDARLSGEVNQSSQPFVYRFVRPERPEAKLWVVFSPWGIANQAPVIQDVTINIAPETQATLITMTGKQTMLTADGSGNVTVTSTSSPVYVKVGE